MRCAKFSSLGLWDQYLAVPLGVLRGTEKTGRWNGDVMDLDATNMGHMGGYKVVYTGWKTISSHVTVESPSIHAAAELSRIHVGY